MGRAIEALLLLGVFMVMAGAITAFISVRRRPRKCWEINEHTTPTGLLIVVERDGEFPWVVGSVTTSDEERGWLLAKLRSQAEDVCAELNAGRRP